PGRAERGRAGDQLRPDHGGAGRLGPRPGTDDPQLGVRPEGRPATRPWHDHLQRRGTDAEIRRAADALRGRLDPGMSDLLQLRELVRQFVDERVWDQFHSPKNLASALTVEAAELLEHFQWLQLGRAKELGVSKLA